MPGIEYVNTNDLNAKTNEWERSLLPFAENRISAVKKPALLIVDMQRYFVSPDGRAYLPAARTVLPNILRLIEFFRTEKLPLIFTRHGNKRGQPAGLMDSWWKGRLLYETDDDAELVVNPANNETVLRKEYYDAFRNTELDDILKKEGADTLVICGVMTDLCVETTARQAFMNGYQPVVALDGTATKNEELHLSSLRTLAHGFACVETISSILENIG